MFGSNYPVASLFARYDTIVRGMFEILKGLPRPALDAFFFGNAQRFYCID
jgi:predicted TIM-barrel fold metal-dependent hydrolase